MPRRPKACSPPDMKCPEGQAVPAKCSPEECRGQEAVGTDPLRHGCLLQLQSVRLQSFPGPAPTPVPLRTGTEPRVWGRWPARAEVVQVKGKSGHGPAEAILLFS